jgi:hypothetical protein
MQISWRAVNTDRASQFLRKSGAAEQPDSLILDDRLSGDQMKLWNEAPAKEWEGSTLPRQSRLTVGPQLDRRSNPHRPFSSSVPELQTFRAHFILNDLSCAGESRPTPIEPTEKGWKLR